MSRKKRIDTTAEDVAIIYANPLAVIVDLLKPQFFYYIGGRGSTKTTVFLARRTYHVGHEMPGCYVALSGDTYMNLLKNVIPQLVLGFERQNQWKEDIHFVIGKRPPKHFKKPHKPPLNWKHSITIHTGCHIKLISLDRPSIGAGDSYQHYLGDEVKYQPKEKVTNLSLAVRGESYQYQNSPLYMGASFTTDMADPNKNEHDWIEDLKKNMNKEQILLMYETALTINEIRIELYHAEKNKDEIQIKLLQKNLARWESDFNEIRKKSTFFVKSSSYVNADILTAEYFVNLYNKMDFRDFKRSVLSIKPKLEKGEMFYPNLSLKNFYKDSYNYNILDQEALTRDGIYQDSRSLKHLWAEEPIELGLDTGRMCSLTIGQPQGEVYRVLKFMYSLGEEYLNGLAKKFREFFKHHPTKTVLLWADRSANQNRSMGDDQASKFKKAIEFEDEIPTDWSCTIMTIGQGVIYHHQEYELMLAMCSGTQNLPLLLLPDSEEAKELKASLELSKIETKEGKDGKRTIHKIKSSEKLALERLPMESTNPSDSLKYLLWRPEHYNKIFGETQRFSNAPGTY